MRILEMDLMEKGCQNEDQEGGFFGAICSRIVMAGKFLAVDFTRSEFSFAARFNHVGKRGFSFKVLVFHGTHSLQVFRSKVSRSFKSEVAIISLVECIAHRGRPRSSVGMPVFADMIGPTVLPEGISERLAAF